MNDVRRLLEAIESGAVGDPPTVLAWAAGRSLELVVADVVAAVEKG